MNIQEQKEKVVNQVVKEAEERSAIADIKVENVQIKIVDGEVYLSSIGLITVFELNRKRKSLSKAEKGIMDRVVNTLKEYHAAGTKMILEEAFTTGDQVVYKGGQYPSDRPRLDPNVIYTVEAATNGLFRDQNHPQGIWKVCLFLVEFPAPDDQPEKRPAFLATLFTHPKAAAEATENTSAGENEGTSAGDGNILMPPGYTSPENTTKGNPLRAVLHGDGGNDQE